MYYPPDLLDFLGSCVLAYLIPTITLIATPKRSPWRYGAILALGVIMHHLMRPHEAASAVRIVLSCTLLTIFLTATNILLINPLDESDLARERPGALILSDRLWYAFELVAFPRAINTPRQVRNVPAHPPYLQRNGDGAQISRNKFLVRQSVIFVWQYLVLDIFQTLAHLDGEDQDPNVGFSKIELFVPFEIWIKRLVLSLMAGFISTRILIDAHYRFSSLVFVGLGLDVPDNWPPLFGTMADAYTLRNYWGKFWHQFLRQSLTGISNFVARDVLRLPRRSPLERYTNVFVVCMVSASIHMTTDYVQCVPPEYSGAIPFFMSIVLGFMIEDNVLALWKGKMNSSDDQSDSKAQTVTPIRYKVIGFIWTLVWLVVSSTWYMEPISQLPQKIVTLVAFGSPSEKLGLPSILVATATISAVVRFMLGGEV
ncbi:hypothetical protein N7456_011066 [Penicillium angulare]|uniref:Wax synthase domain-containing protein n=1 Tax=Penicillium angulare TaxID=116970 RepID=A0A9W9JZQ0_9EURO|nr:hypothetical protein N7456_011066 [Penicillium angulare]